MVMFIGLVVYLIVILPSNASPVGTGELRSLPPGAPGAASFADEMSDSRRDWPHLRPFSRVQTVVLTPVLAPAPAPVQLGRIGVRACNGDPIRAATIIAGELAAY